MLRRCVYFPRPKQIRPRPRQLRGCQRRGRATSKSQQRYFALQQIRRFFYSLFISGAKKLDATSTRTSPTDRGLARFPPSIPKFGSSQSGGFVSSIPTSDWSTQLGGRVSDTIFLKTTPCKVEIRVTRHKKTCLGGPLSNAGLHIRSADHPARNERP